ncbi:MAG: phytoene dehydrogenase [Chloroflexi bacterium]|nr:MAG: phytoene dehydrogenase [Chloroflexota bacterium]
MDYDVIIIGAGMSGLAAGIRLAYYDRKVCILERHHRVGGLSSFYRRKGHDIDVGLHAMTNYVPRSVKLTPLPKLLRQLKLRPEDFDLRQQRVSVTRFPEKSLRFSNDFDLFVQEVRENFPRQIDNFQKLVKTIFEYDELALDAKPLSARQIVSSYITDPLLVEMLFCPLMFYGSSQENDIEFGQFVIMFKGIYHEGFARPQAGIRQILDTLVRQYESHGGHLRLKCGVQSLQVSNGKVTALVLDNGEVLRAERIISSIGYIETLRLLSDYDPARFNCEEGRISLVEFIFVLDREPAHLGYDTTITFFNTSEKFHYQRPEDLVDLSSGVICCPNNFKFDKPLPEGMIRITNLANYQRWNDLNQEEYSEQKAAWQEKALQQALSFVPDFRDCIVFTDMFTPKTIYRYTGHLNGAVYGAPNKVKDGRTHLDNLFLCGTDQGFLGIVGSMLSGISMANLHVLQKT